MVEIIFLTLLTSIVATIFGIRIDFKNYLKIAIYAVTLPYIIEVISVLVVGSVKDYAVITSNVLSYVYIFYAIRAVKLDAFLLFLNSNQNKKKEDNKNNDDNDGGKDA